VRKPNISQEMRRALEECGTETIRTILLHGWANREGFPEVIQRIAEPSSERKDAAAWLKWKDARQASWVKVAAIAAVLAAIFSGLALVK
jgi:hypothetical protein